MTADVDFGEILDYLIYDNRTHYILLYVEGIRNARRFMSALRSAARIKPIILLKAGRHAGRLGGRCHPLGHGRRSPTSCSMPPCAAPASSACKNVGQLFYAAKALASKFRPLGNRLAIITNGGGPGAMAADRAGDLGIPLAELSDETMAALNKTLPTNWSHSNPIDIAGDATPERYRDAILAVTAGPRRRQHAGHALAAGDDAADGSRQGDHRSQRQDSNRSIICCWMGEEQVAEARTAA